MRARALEFFRLNERRSESRRAVHESCPAAAREERGGGVVPWRRDGIGEISLPTANASQFGSGNGADGVEAEPVEQKLQCETSVGRNKFRKENKQTNTLKRHMKD